MTVSITEPLPMPLGGWDPLDVRPRFGTYRGLVRLALGHLDHMSGRLGDPDVRPYRSGLVCRYMIPETRRLLSVVPRTS